ncbi:MAG: TetR/AcrR family transcriptional regulator [Rhizomicrobium sp.]|jgi:AcrR family transcriptional regulator
MARTQAADYEDRRGRIVEKAAKLYAERGFLGASISDLAKACKTSKSLIYHYYPSKEDILFDVMHSHVAVLLETAKTIRAQTLPPTEKLRAITQEFMKHYVGAAARQKVLLNELWHLPKERRAVIVGIQHKLIDMVQAILAEVRPELGGRSALRLPAAMLYFGMINWTHTWMDPSGPAKPSKIAELSANIFLDGILDAEIPR